MPTQLSDESTPAVLTEEYQSLIEQEGQVWGAAASELAEQVPPDWQAMKHLPHNVFVYGQHIEALLNRIQPGWKVLEIGCSSGWLSLEMARHGALVQGVDVAASAVQVARQYAKDHPPTGSVTYRTADINLMTLDPDQYDLIVAVGVLHHLAEVERVLDQCKRALHPGGLIWVLDPMDTPRANAILNGALMMVLPTTLSYPEKFRHLLRLRGHTVAHLKDSIEAKGLSPFEGYGRHQAPLTLLKTNFKPVSLNYESAFVGYLTANMKLPHRALMIVGRVLWCFDKLLVKTRILQGLVYVIVAQN